MTQRFWWMAVAAAVLALGARAAGQSVQPAGEEKVCPQCKAACVKEKVADLMSQFQRLYKEGKYAEAACVALKVRELDPENAAAEAAADIARIHNSNARRQRIKEARETLLLVRECTADTAAACGKKCCNGNADCCKNGSCCAAVAGKAGCAACTSKTVAAEVKSAVAVPPPPVPPVAVMPSMNYYFSTLPPAGVPAPSAVPTMPPMPSAEYYPVGAAPTPPVAPSAAADVKKTYVVEARLAGAHVVPMKFGTMQVVENCCCASTIRIPNAATAGAGEEKCSLMVKVKPSRTGKARLYVTMTAHAKMGSKTGEKGRMTVNETNEYRRTVKFGKPVKLPLWALPEVGEKESGWLEVTVREGNAVPATPTQAVYVPKAAVVYPSASVAYPPPPPPRPVPAVKAQPYSQPCYPTCNVKAAPVAKCAATGSVKANASAGTMNALTICAGMTNGQCCLEVGTGTQACVTCENLTVTTPGFGAIRFDCSQRRVMLCGPGFKATANRVVMEGNRLILLGCAEMERERAGQLSHIEASQLIFSMKDGRMEPIEED